MTKLDNGWTKRIEELERREKVYRESISQVLCYVVGEPPQLGYLRDCNGSRDAIQELYKALAQTDSK